jgi:ABC-2 type transport system permease protein
MFSHLRHHLGLALCFCRFTVQTQLEYPIFLLGWFLMIPIQYFSGIWMIHILVSRFHSIAGWAFPELAFLYGLALISHGFTVVFFIQTWGVEFAIREGRFDRYKLRPVNVYFQFLCQYVNLIGCIDLIPAFAIFFYSTHLLHFSFTLSHIEDLVVVVVGATMIRAGIYTMVGSIAFWTQRSRAVISITVNLLQQSTSYPLTIYPWLLQWAFTLLFPAAFIAFFPAKVLLGQSAATESPGAASMLTAGCGVLFFLLGIGVFQRGLKRYESSGS